LVKEGLGDARRAVGALRGEGLPTVEQLEQLLKSFRKDMDVEATLQIEGSARPLSPEAHLRYDTGRTVLSIEDRAATGARMNGLGGVGGGRGLDGMRERVERAGGHMQAGPTDEGWRVQLEVPA
jgi:signal transduction histidine kinase